MIEIYIIIAIAVIAGVAFYIVKKRKKKAPIVPVLDNQQGYIENDNPWETTQPNEVLSEEKITIVKDGESVKGVMKRMAQGLQIWDEYGNLIFDSSINTTRILGTFNTGTSNGSFTVTNSGGRKVWAVVNNITTNTTGYDEWTLLSRPKVYVDGTTIKWEMQSISITGTAKGYLTPTYQSVAYDVLYGVY